MTTRQISVSRRTRSLAAQRRRARPRISPPLGVVDVVAVYPRNLTAAEVGEKLLVRAFPPAGLLSLPRADQHEIVFIVPVSEDKRDWGVLAAVGRIQDSTPAGREMMNHSGALLAVALEHDEMLRALREQEGSRTC